MNLTPVTPAPSHPHRRTLAGATLLFAASLGVFACSNNADSSADNGSPGETTVFTRTTDGFTAVDVADTSPADVQSEPAPTTASATTTSAAPPTTAAPTTASPTTAAPTTASPTTAAPTTAPPTTAVESDPVVLGASGVSIDCTTSPVAARVDLGAEVGDDVRWRVRLIGHPGGTGMAPIVTTAATGTQVPSGALVFEVPLHTLSVAVDTSVDATNELRTTSIGLDRFTGCVNEPVEGIGPVLSVENDCAAGTVTVIAGDDTTLTSVSATQPGGEPQLLGTASGTYPLPGWGTEDAAVMVSIIANYNGAPLDGHHDLGAICGAPAPHFLQNEGPSFTLTMDGQHWTHANISVNNADGSVDDLGALDGVHQYPQPAIARSVTFTGTWLGQEVSWTYPVGS